ncbi:hypothetical protein J2X01_003945 [Arthrobacter ginsengisoli]|uniref:Uncharacterized protein n=1 Tax=Arthrobacter ginsengisoli TaxID=1356565 RepID=A0ABU1UHG1_9MICC|nr:hypothetical protein [Arthrobacter ginsengisoli]
MDNEVQIVRQGAGSLTRVSLRGKTELMIAFVTAGVVVVLAKRVAP